MAGHDPRTCTGCGGYAAWKAEQERIAAERLAESKARFEQWLAMTPAEREAWKAAREAERQAAR